MVSEKGKEMYKWMEGMGSSKIGKKGDEREGKNKKGKRVEEGKGYDCAGYGSGET